VLQLNSKDDRSFAPVELKDDLKGKKEFEDYLTKLNLQKADIQGRIEKNKTWIVSSQVDA
jgi:hypothetical protein